MSISSPAVCISLHVHFLGVRRKIVSSLLDVSLTSSYKVCWLANCSDHIILLRALDRVVRTVMFHGALKICRHLCHRDGAVVWIRSIAANAGYMDRTRWVQSC